MGGGSFPKLESLGRGTQILAIGGSLPSSSLVWPRWIVQGRPQEETLLLGRPGLGEEGRIGLQRSPVSVCIPPETQRAKNKWQRAGEGPSRGRSERAPRGRCQSWSRLGLWVYTGSREPRGGLEGHHPEPEVGSQRSSLTLPLPKHTTLGGSLQFIQASVSHQRKGLNTVLCTISFNLRGVPLREALFYFPSYR